MSSTAWRTANADKVRGYWRNWYYRNRATVAAGRKRRKADLKSWLREYKASLLCTDCGEDHPATLDFHHTEPAKKERSLGDIGKYGWSLRKAQAEILNASSCVRIATANVIGLAEWRFVTSR